MLLIQSCTIIHNPDGYPQVTNYYMSAQNSPFAPTVNRETKWTSVKYFPGLSAQTIINNRKDSRFICTIF